MHARSSQGEEVHRSACDCGKLMDSCAANRCDADPDQTSFHVYDLRGTGEFDSKMTAGCPICIGKIMIVGYVSHPDHIGKHCGTIILAPIDWWWAQAKSTVKGGGGGVARGNHKVVDPTKRGIQMDEQKEKRR
ncbi:hypothetical protein Cni_G23798 [Canna indica]|uniref:Uncharacterized protein n=1 Tax=Canna indica TaxID=4628 RepID=A0AAQ3L0Z5_9LILI|nr:hypothetical protein Cni_G23798 [Canna indica]